VRGELREGEGIVVPCLPHQLHGACAGLCGLAIRNCGCLGLPLLELYRCEAHKDRSDSTTYWVTHSARGTDIARLVTVKGLQQYWWEHERAVAHNRVLRARVDVHEQLADRRHIDRKLEAAKHLGDIQAIGELEVDRRNLCYDIKESKEEFKHALLDRSHKCCSECERAFSAHVRYSMLVQIGRRENSIYWDTIHDLVNRTLTGELALPLPTINLEEIPCIVSNNTADIFGTELEEWSDDEEEEEETDDDFDNNTPWEDKEE
jgi:hypothetical protein